MMWPVLTKVQYETLPKLFSSHRLWYQIAFSLLLNWIVGPFIMLGVAWATLPDLPTYRTGVIMVGLARLTRFWLKHVLMLTEKFSQMHCDGDDLEPARSRKSWLLRYSCCCQLYSPNCAVFSACAFVCQRHRQWTQRASTLRKRRNICLDCERSSSWWDSTSNPTSISVYHSSLEWSPVTQ